jgi:cell wall-associated NlpC family hydrolase
VNARDARTTLIHGDVAAASLQGLAPAERFRATTTFQGAAPAASVRPSPGEDAKLDDQLLFGELFEVLDDDGDWAFGQAIRSGYVGYVRREDLTARTEPPSHWVNTLAAEVHAEPRQRSASLGALPMNALVGVEVRDGAFALAAGLGWLRSEQISPIGVHVADYVAAAERFLGQPYLWGGRGGGGIDCSGLVQQGLFAAGRASPRDADQQASLGSAIAAEDLRRGDLVLWLEHVAIVTAPDRILHASFDHGAVVTEPLAEALDRRGGRGDDPIAWRRPVD